MDLAFLDHRQQRTGQTYSQTLWTLRAQAISAPEDLPKFLSGRNFPAVSEKNGGIPCNRVRSIYKCPNDFFRPDTLSTPPAGHYVFTLSAPVYVPCQNRLDHRPAAPATPARCPCGQVHSCANMDSPAGCESITMQKWNSPHGGQVHYTDAAASNNRRRSSDSIP